MFENPEVALLSIIVLCVPLFGSIIYFGLRSRQRNTEQWAEATNARFVQTRVSDPLLPVKSILYGTYSDASFSQVVLTVKDGHDALVGQVVYETVGMNIVLGDDRYHVWNEGTWNFHVSVRLSGQGKSSSPVAECRGSGILNKKYCYDFAGYGQIEVQYRAFGLKAILRQNGRVVGEWLRLGPYELSGKALVLAVDVPVLCQMILLAGPFTKRRSVS